MRRLGFILGIVVWTGWQSWGVVQSQSVETAGTVNFTSSNLPIVVIDTHGKQIVDEPKITADMGIIDHGVGVRNYLTDAFNNYAGKIGIEFRGSTSQSFPKKQYAVETRDAQGENLDVSLLGLPPENDWVLYAPYTDKTLMRNVLAYHLSNALGRYASRTRYCELVLNGDYQGVYVLMEKIKRNSARVNIAKLRPTDISGDALTGGYIIKIDKPDGIKNSGWPSVFKPVPGAWQQIYYQYHYPDQDEIVAPQQAYIQKFMAEFETCMSRKDFANPQTGYPKYVEVASLVDHALLVEIAKNVDGYRLSAFMYKDRDSRNPRLIMGPIWDYNIAFGNADYYHAQYFSGWQVHFYQPDDNWLNPFWWPKVWTDSNFVNLMHTRWTQLRQDVLTVPRIDGFIDSLVFYLDEAQKRNFQRWPILDQYVWPNPFIGRSYLAEIRHFKEWVQNRMLWMDARMPGRATLVPEPTASDWPGNCELAQNYPNPFNPGTQIRYFLPQSQPVQLTIFNLQGAEVRTLQNEFTPAGEHLVNWDGSDTAGQPVSAGIYYCVLTADKIRLTRRLVKLR
ncbi:CotH kinase family protein [candidate division KSB1 bacterium]|nr:CotH kinase family protein [candidate division KSB1 bacterium]